MGRGGGGITQQPDKEGNKRADCLHTTSIKKGEGGGNEGRGKKRRVIKF